MAFPEIHTSIELMQLISEVGFLPLLDSGIDGFNAEEIVDEDCRYVAFDGGGWDWPLWKWKGQIVTDGNCVYGKFFNKKAGFISRDWWEDFCNYRRAKHPMPDDGTIERAILDTLRETGSLITRELRAACGFGAKTRSKFDSYVTKLEMGCRIVTEDFVYPRDSHNRQYGWGWSLLNTPEALYGKQACESSRTPEESYARMAAHLEKMLPDATDKQIARLIG